MKRQIFSILLVSGAMVLGTSQLNAACSGTSEAFPITFCGSEERSEGESQALSNCCEGSKIYWDDPCTGLSGSWTILQNGPNSSCSVE